jgi:transposase-like protein
MAVKKRRRYTDEERADLMVMLTANGYPDTVGALKKVADYANINPRVLRRWWIGTQNPPPDKLVAHKKKSLAELFDEVARNYLVQALDEDVIADTDGKSAVIAAATATDKARLLRGESTQRIEITWEQRAIDDIRSGAITYPALAEAFDDSTAARLFAAAGVSVQVGTGESEE